MSIKFRQAIEKRIAKKLIEALVAAGFQISVCIEPTNSCDAQDHEIWKSTNIAAIIKAMFAGDEDWVKVYDPNSKEAVENGDDAMPDGWVRMVYGNDGWDVIGDYTTNLESQLAPVIEFAETLEDNPFAGMKEHA